MSRKEILISRCLKTNVGFHVSVHELESSFTHWCLQARHKMKDLQEGTSRAPKNVQFLPLSPKHNDRWCKVHRNNATTRAQVQWPALPFGTNGTEVLKWGLPLLQSAQDQIMLLKRKGSMYQIQNFCPKESSRTSSLLVFQLMSGSQPQMHVRITWGRFQNILIQ